MTPDEIAEIQEWLLILEARDLELPEFHAMQLKVAKATHVMLDRIAALEAELIEAFKRVNFISEDAEMELREAYAHVVLVDTRLDAERTRRESAETLLQAGRDVMAVIHGDGGHYREAHGDRKAADDAINIVIKLRVDLNEEHSRRRIAEAMLLARCTDAEIDAHFARYKD